MLNVGIKNSHCVASTTHTGDHRIRLTTDQSRHLGQALVTNHPLKITHHGGVWVRARHRTDDVERVLDIGDPIAQGFVERVFQCFAAAIDRHHRGAQQLHAVNVG